MAGVQAFSKYIGHKVSRARWCPRALPSDSCLLATAGWDNGGSNAVSVWRIANEHPGDRFDSTQPLGDPTLVCGTSSRADVTGLESVSEEMLVACTGDGIVRVYAVDEAGGTCQEMASIQAQRCVRPHCITPHTDPHTSNSD